jgi:hypothetical protein
MLCTGLALLLGWFYILYDFASIIPNDIPHEQATELRLGPGTLSVTGHFLLYESHSTGMQEKVGASGCDEWQRHAEIVNRGESVLIGAHCPGYSGAFFFFRDAGGGWLRYDFDERWYREYDLWKQNSTPQEEAFPGGFSRIKGTSDGGIVVECYGLDIRRLTFSLAEDGSKVLLTAVEPYSAHGDPFDRYMEMLKTVGDDDWGWIAGLLGYAGVKQAIVPLVEALADTKAVSSQKRIAAATALGRLGAHEAVDVLVAAVLADPHWWVRDAAAEALGALGDRRAVEPLVRGLATLDTEGAIPATWALHLLTDKNFGADAGKWKVWWAENRRSFMQSAGQGA